MARLPEQADAGARRGRRDRRPGRFIRAVKTWVQAGNGRKSYHSWLKHYSRRLFRRWGKQDPEGAPRKNRYRGWET